MDKLSLAHIIKKIKKTKFPKFDLIIGIGKDGIMPASLLQHFLKLPVEIIWINYRDKNNNPKRKEPILKKPLNKRINALKNKKILLVDTVSRTGKTLDKAKHILNGNKIKTFVINGKADFNITDKKECILFPWSQK